MNLPFLAIGGMPFFQLSDNIGLSIVRNLGTPTNLQVNAAVHKISHLFSFA